MKTHTRNLSASLKKTSYSNNPSPNNSAYLKKDRSEIFQISDLKLSLNMPKSPNKDKEIKNTNTNFFINNLNVQIKPATPGSTPKKGPFTTKNSTFFKQIDKKFGSQGKRKNDDSNDQETEHQGKIERNLSHEQLKKNYREGNQYVTFNKQKGTPTMKLRKSGGFELSQSDFLMKLKANPKKSSTPRGNIALESSLKQHIHTKNKKSFDFGSLMSSPKTKQLSDLFNNKHLSIINNELQSPNRIKPNVEENVTQFFSAGQQSKKHLTKSTPFDNANSQHKRSPSFDMTAKDDNIFQKKREAEPKINRKSIDGGIKFLNSSSPEIYNKKIHLRFAVKSRAGMTAAGTRKTNQDSFIAQSNFGRNPNRYLFGICDGHGTNGHLVSGFVKDALPSYLLADSYIETKPETAFINAFELCHQKLMFCGFDTKFSGTTCVTLLINGNRIISSNAGDSRAIMASFDEDWDCTPLSNDHKPNLIGEAQRIIMAGGRIEAFQDEEGNPVGPSRVWLMDQDIPGLAMSRSIGDFVAASVGVSCRPEVREFQITQEDKFIILASDGVWEFIDNLEAVKMVAPFYQQNNLEGACDYLLAAALKRWQEEEEKVVDDITLIIIFL